MSTFPPPFHSLPTLCSWPPSSHLSPLLGRLHYPLSHCPMPPWPPASSQPCSPSSFCSSSHCPQACGHLPCGEEVKAIACRLVPGFAETGRNHHSNCKYLGKILGGFAPLLSLLKMPPTNLSVPRGCCPSNSYNGAKDAFVLPHFFYVCYLDFSARMIYPLSLIYLIIYLC